MTRLTPVNNAYRRAFKGFTGPLDAVQEGDFQEALRLLRAFSQGMAAADWNANDAAAKAFLARLQPEGR